MGVACTERFSLSLYIKSQDRGRDTGSQAMCPIGGPLGASVDLSPLVSFVYERGWRQGFAWAGFPGEEKEFEMGE
eukprot:902775-Pelagomonas_calceolata.AAC.6